MGLTSVEDVKYKPLIGVRESHILVMCEGVWGSVRRVMCEGMRGRVMSDGVGCGGGRRVMSEGV